MTISEAGEVPIETMLLQVPKRIMLQGRSCFLLLCQITSNKAPTSSDAARPGLGLNEVA